ncbi:histone-lysine N-methyltransferase CLF-like [Papaver somniferum]|uniref:histone-lysine N-methyltransferase CLF-like n=1 Tax=Papaver somniferum TaxID=3469 RepID=UPI000E7024E9|nr:histone-lysine N-methyltransferase CLF-like [Papaver somniferum]
MDITTTQTMNGVKMSAQNSGRDIQLVLESLKKQVAIDRCVFVKKKMEENRQKLIGITKHVHSATKMRMSNTICVDNCVDLLTKRQQDALCTLNGAKEDHEESNALSIVPIGNSSGVKNLAHPVTLAKVSKIPPYTTWVFLKRNQRMTEDQSVVGRRRIYYDQIGGEALIASDSEEEEVGDEEDQKEFSDAEDFILRNAIQQVGLSVDVLNSLAKCFSRRPSDIKARYDILNGENPMDSSMKADLKDETKIEDIFCDKDLDAALDSFDNLFCRRCLVFDCRLHGCSQDLVFPAEKQLPWAPPDSETVPCGSCCYQMTLNSESVASGSCSAPGGFEDKAIASSGSGGHQTSRGKKTKSNQSDHTSNARNILDISELDIRSQEEKFSTQQSSPPNKRVAGHIVSSMQKRRKKLSASDSDSVADGSPWIKDRKLRSSSRKDNEDQNETLPVEAQQEPCHKMIKDYLVECNDDTSRVDELADENMDKPWSTFEKCLYSKGLDMFGKNSCLIARNLLVGMKTCAEVFQYMSYTENKLCHRAEGSNSAEGQTQGDHNDTTGRTGSRFMRRKGKVRRVKYGAGYHAFRKRIIERKDLLYKQFNPCNCQSACGKQCTCHLGGTCCEKYCGCSKTCKNRFRGCHCAKGQCRSRQCPCFAADRECDPDVCRNCWVDCGDGTLGGPPQRGDNYECRNMKLLLKQQQRVLLGRSDVSGWGAFLKNGVNKNEYLGEYTGELISHREADKRGKIYDLENSSFLFNLNDQFVLDAHRKGDKLKFANHSPNPNCYAKVMMVAGDHKVGIFADQKINAGEELFYDYHYAPDSAASWAKKPEILGSKKVEVASSIGRAKKRA